MLFLEHKDQSKPQREESEGDPGATGIQEKPAVVELRIGTQHRLVHLTNFPHNLVKEEQVASTTAVATQLKEGGEGWV